MADARQLHFEKTGDPLADLATITHDLGSLTTMAAVLSEHLVEASQHLAEIRASVDEMLAKEAMIDGLSACKSSR